MSEAEKTKEQLVGELAQLRQRVTELEASETEHKQAEQELKLEADKLGALADGLARVGIGTDIVGIDYKVQFQNQVLQERFGDLTGESCYKGYMALEKPCDFCPMMEATKTKKVKSVELRAADGRDYQILSAPIPNRDGTVDKAIEVILDITERKQAEEGLWQSEERYRALFDRSLDSVYIHDFEGNFIDANQVALNLLGYEKEEIPSLNFASLLSEGQIPKAFDMLEELKETGTQQELTEYVLERKNGEYVCVETKASVIYRGGKPYAIQGMARDVTERKQADGALRESEEKYRTVLEEMEDSYFEVDLSGHITFANESTCHNLRLSREELMGASYQTFSAEKSIDDVYKAFNKAYRTGKPVKSFSWEIVRGDGSTGFAETTVLPLHNQDGQIIGFRGIAHDVTERKQAEEALRRSEERFRTILEEMEDGYHELDLAGNFTFFNDSTCRTLGYSREELMGMNYRAYTPPEDVKTVFENYNRVYRTGEPLRGFSYRTIRKDRSITFAEVSTFPLRNQEGENIGFRGIRRDVTERKQAEEALTQSEEKYRLLADNVSDVIWTMDMNLRHTYVSPSVTGQRGYSVEEAMAQPVEETMTPASLEVAARALVDDLAPGNATERGPSQSHTLELELYCKDGSTIWTEMVVSVLRDPDGTPVSILGMTRDIRERKQLEEERKELEQKAHLESRLATVGLLASGVGHEINNPLTGVIGYSELLLEKDLPEDVKKDLKTINEGAQRVANIVKKLVAFARYQKPERTYASINDTLATTLDLVAHQLNTSNIKGNLQLDPNLPGTVVDIGQLQQVFLNIAINAETEMRLAHGKGKLSIKTEKTDNTIRISFKDNGPGIAEENLDKIFDPFFTTRKVGQGTGLGLSICHEIIAEHGGRLYAQSEPGKGATFIVELPVVTEEEQAQAPEPVAEEAVKVAGARVLVVDDEPVVLAFVTRVLTDEGHEVETVDNAEDALKKIKSERYSLILLDIKLPGMRGDELYKRIQRIAGSLARRVVFITGDVLAADTIEFLARTQAPYVAKPFDAKQLKKAVNRILV